jgi:hypothetical protein
MTDKPLDLDKQRGMAAQKATDLRRILLDVENNAKELRERQALLEDQLLSVSAASWLEASAKARYVLNLYAALSRAFRCNRTDHSPLSLGVISAVLVRLLPVSDQAFVTRVSPN